MQVLFNQREWADYQIIIKSDEKQVIADKKVQSVSFSVKTEMSREELTQLVFKELEAYTTIKSLDSRYKYRVSIVPLGKNSSSCFTYNFPENLIQTRQILMSSQSFSPIINLPSTHYIVVKNLLSREYDNRWSSLLSDASLDVLKEYFRMYCEQILQKIVDDDIVFPGETSRVSHRVLLMTAMNGGTRTYKSRSFSVRFPYYSSSELLEYLKRTPLTKEEMINEQDNDERDVK